MEMRDRSTDPGLKARQAAALLRIPARIRSLRLLPLLKRYRRVEGIATSQVPGHEVASKGTRASPSKSSTRSPDPRYPLSLVETSSISAPTSAWCGIGRFGLTVHAQKANSARNSISRSESLGRGAMMRRETSCDKLPIWQQSWQKVGGMIKLKPGGAKNTAQSRLERPAKFVWSSGYNVPMRREILAESTRDPSDPCRKQVYVVAAPQNVQEEVSKCDV